MDIDWVRAHCLSLPHATEKIQWQDDLVFKVGKKMFAVVALEPAAHAMSFKCSPENFAALIERPGIAPAPYMARAQWVALETVAALPRAELQSLLAEAHALVFAKLPKRTQSLLSSTPPKKRSAPARRKARGSTRRSVARKRK